MPPVFARDHRHHPVARRGPQRRSSVKQVRTVLGHSSAAITLKVSSHLWPGDQDRRRLVMDNALGPLADCLRTERVSEG
jgi:hypothetical protein